MLKKFVALFGAAMLALVLAVSRYSANDMATWILPSDWALGHLSKLSLGWSGGSLEQLAIIGPGGWLVVEEAHWKWQIQINPLQPLKLLSVNAQKAKWSSFPEPAVNAGVMEHEAETDVRLKDFRKSTWWPSIASSSVRVREFLLDVADVAVIMRMDDPITIERGALTVYLDDVRFDLDWAQRSQNTWVGTSALAGSISADGQWELTALGQEYILTGNLSVPELSISTEQIELRLTPFKGAEAETPFISAQAKAHFEFPDPLSDRRLEAEAMALISETGGGRLTLTTLQFESVVTEERLAGRIEATWSSALRDTSITLSDGEIYLRDIDLGEFWLGEVRAGVAGSLNPDSGIFSLNTSRTHLALQGTEWSGVVQSNGLLVKGNSQRQIASGSLKVDAWTEGRFFPSIDTTVSITAFAGNVQTEVKGFAPWGPLVELRVQYSPEDKASRFEANLDSTLWNWPLLRTALAASIPELADVEITSLKLRLDALGEWSEKGIFATVSGQASDGYFSLPGLGVAGLELAPFSLRIANKEVEPVIPIEFALDAVYAGITLSDLVGAMGKDDKGWLLIHADSRMLGGELVVDQFRDFTSDGPLGIVYLNDIDLATVLDIAGTDGVNIQGRADVTLPLSWQNGMMLVEAGTMRGSPGFLQYQPSVKPVAIDRRISAVAAALSDLHFEQLDADITLDESGMLYMQTVVLGNNPDYEKGRQVKLNLTLENNLLSLLKSLQTVESVNLWVTRNFEQ